MAVDYKALKELAHGLYQDGVGNPLELTEGQLDIFSCIATKHVPGQESTAHKRVQVETYTQYGKSETAAVGVLTRVTSYPEKWIIGAGTKAKAQIIMGKLIGHIFDNEYTKNRFMLDKGESLESIRKHRNKNHITFDLSDQGKGLISEVLIVSAKDALGMGAPNVIQDESALIPDDFHSLMMRMLTGSPKESFLMKIGNPFARNHFLKSHNDPAYYKIIVDCFRGLREGRISPETIKENEPYTFFKVLYEVKFPGAEEMDESGWLYLFKDDDLEVAKTRVLEPFGIPRLGVDVARGGRNFNAWVLRLDNYARVLKKSKEADLMIVADDTEAFMKDLGVSPENVFIDDTGVGGGVTDRLRQKGYKSVNAVRLGEKAQEAGMENVRAEVYAGKEGLSNWVRRTGKLEDHADWTQILEIRYRESGERKTVLESKDDMRKRGVESPDIADALALTFAQNKVVHYKPVDPKTILDHAVKPFIPGVG